MLTENFGNVGVVHVWELLKNLASLVFGPDHEGVHWPFNMGLLFLWRLAKVAWRFMIVVYEL